MTPEENFEINKRLVYFVFNRKYKQLQNLKDDLIQCGFIGLWKACLNFRKDLKVEFSTYAIKCITNEMRGFLRKENHHRLESSLSDFRDKDLIYVPEETFVLPKTLQASEIEYINRRLNGATRAEAAAGLGNRFKLQKKLREKLREEL